MTGKGLAAMVISHSNRFVVFGGWKCASTTTSVRLKKLNQSPYRMPLHVNPYFRRIHHGHLTCAEFTALPESRLGYFKATFVRNPYDRAYSGFLQVVRTAALDLVPAADTPWLSEVLRRGLDEMRAQLRAADSDFDTWISQLTEDQVYIVGAFAGHMLHPAHYWSHLGPDQYVDFIGRTESYEADFGALCARLQIEVSDTRSLNVSSDSATVDERGYRYPPLMNRASIDKLNHLFAADFDLFGYTPL